MIDQLIGSRMIVANAELRVPLWSLFGKGDFYGPLPIEMAVFGDAARPGIAAAVCISPARIVTW